ncbi:MAG: hypothetical protein B0W54_03130 [Cellvibrio sp. 79]|nr:MAG: hypothetical protein B0W54_03130 [Cellvibrio sp. 79]
MIKSTRLISFMGLLAISTSLPLHADTLKVDMKPGLWEHRIKLIGGNDLAAQTEQMQQAMEEVKKQMANLPPEQRKMMEDMMAQQGMKFSDQGVSMQNDKVQISKDGTIVKQCVTQAQIDKGYVPETGSECKPEITQTSKTKFKTTYTCTGQQSASGEGEIEFVSPTQYKGKAYFITNNNGQSQRYDTEQSGSWLASDCGNVKPENY